MLNFKHLHYFWVTAKEGSIARACERLHLTPQTISAQITQLEEQLGKTLFDRVGRRLELNDTGRLVLGYADDIFSLGNELGERVRSLPAERSHVFRVGITDAVPKSIAYRLLAPAFESAEPVRMICREGPMEDLLAELAIHRIDLVIADGPLPSGLNVRGFNHPLGECGVTFFAQPEISAGFARPFPTGLDGAPLLLPGERSLLHGELLRWLERHRISPRIVGEVDDSALMKAFGQGGSGVFIGPSAIEAETERQYGVPAIGRSEEIRARFFAISVERRISHPTVTVITESAREWLASAPG